MTISLDDETLVVPNAVTAIVTKIPYYGYKMKVVPNAVFDDGQLHLLAINSGWAEIVGGMANAFLYENKLGIYRKAREIRITMQRERYAQLDGSIYRKGTDFPLPGPAPGPADVVLIRHGARQDALVYKCGDFTAADGRRRPSTSRAERPAA